MSRITTKYIFDYHDDTRDDYNNKAANLFNQQYMSYDHFKTSNYVAERLKTNETFSIDAKKLENYPVWRILKYICSLNNYKGTANTFSPDSNMFGYFGNTDYTPLFAINTLDSIKNDLYLDADTVMFVSARTIDADAIINHAFRELKFINSEIPYIFAFCSNLISCNYLYNYNFNPDNEELNFIDPRIQITYASRLTEVGINDEISVIQKLHINNCPISYFELPDKIYQAHGGLLRNCQNIFDVSTNYRAKFYPNTIENCSNFQSCSIDLSISPIIFANTIKNLRIVIPKTVTEIKRLVGNNSVIEHLHIKNESSNIKYYDDFIYNCPNLKTITGNAFGGGITDGQRRYNFIEPINFENKYNCFESDCVLKMYNYNTTTFTYPHHMSRFYNMIGRINPEIRDTNIDYKIDVKILEDGSDNPYTHYGVTAKIRTLYGELINLANNSNNITISLRLYNFQKFYENNVYYLFIVAIRNQLINNYPDYRRVSIRNDDHDSVIVELNY